MSFVFFADPSSLSPMASIPAPTRANSPAISVDLGPTPSPPSLPSAAQGHVNGVLPVPLSQPLPTPETNLDFMSDEYLSELGHHATELCASVAGIGMALNVRRYLGYSSFREAPFKGRMPTCEEEGSNGFATRVSPGGPEPLTGAQPAAQTSEERGRPAGGAAQCMFMVERVLSGMNSVGIG